MSKFFFSKIISPKGLQTVFVWVIFGFLLRENLNPEKCANHCGGRISRQNFSKSFCVGHFLVIWPRLNNLGDIPEFLVTPYECGGVEIGNKSLLWRYHNRIITHTLHTRRCRINKNTSLRKTFRAFKPT